jgi:hypothetical protein
MALASELLAAAKQIIDFYRERADVAPKVRERLSVIETDLGKLLDFVKETEGFVVLDSSLLEKPKSNGGMEVWNALPPGQHSDTGKIHQFIDASPLLDSLFRKGIDITQFYKFSSSEIQLARSLGDRFAEFSGGLSELRRSRDGRKEFEKTFLIKCMEENGRFLEFLQKEGIGRVEQCRIQKDGVWKPFRLEWFRNNEKETNIHIVFKVKDLAAFRLLRGEWLNAYVYNIILDHLTRNRASFELYTDITYRAPADIIRVVGEFDVIGLFQNKLICVECKSGRVTSGRSDTLETVVAKIADLQKAVGSVSREKVEFLFYLVFDPTLNDENEIARSLEGSSIKPLRPDQVRAEIVKTFLL